MCDFGHAPPPGQYDRYGEQHERRSPPNQQHLDSDITPEEHPAIVAALDCYTRVSTPLVPSERPGGGMTKAPRLSRWIFSTDGVGVPLPLEDDRVVVADSKEWVVSGAFKHPAMFGIGPGIEQNTHKIGESVDSREMGLVIAFLARFPSLYREQAPRS